MVLPRTFKLAVASVTALVLVAAVYPASAAPLLQEAGGNDRMEVIAWTLAAVAVAMVLLAVGYFYRRAAGIDKPPPVTILEPGQRITED